MQDEEQRILAEVKKRKERAQQSGVVTSAFMLYRHDLRHYDGWEKHCPDQMHPEIRVVEKTTTSVGGQSAERIAATIRGNPYVFTFRECSSVMPDGEYYDYGYLDVDFQGQRVMTIDCGCSDDRYTGRTWYTREVSAFIEGPWIDELNAVFGEVKLLHEEHRRRWEELGKKEEIEQLKKNFGL